MAIKIISATHSGLDGVLINVEVDITKGIPIFNIVGLPDISIKESKERVRLAIVNSGYEFPLGRITVNLAPGNLRKVGTGFDLPIALAILILILVTQIFIFAKFFLGGPGNKEGQISAPDLYNLTLDEAQRSLDKLNLNIRVNIEDEYSNEVEKGKIISQQPMSGATLQEGDTVTLVLSKGPMKGYIPNVVGLTLGEAENILKENKLSLGNIKYEYSDTYNNGIVIAQDPKSGSESNQEWGTVNVVVSKGKKEEVVQPPEEDDEEEEVQPPNVAPINPGSPNSGNQNGSNDNQSQDSNTGGNDNQPGQGNGEQDTEIDAGGTIEPPQAEVPQSQEN